MVDPFFTLHRGLHREGPGTPQDVAWAAQTVDLAPDAKICDAGCGPGADTETFLTLLPQGRITAIDGQQQFIDELHGRIGVDPRVTAFKGNMLKLKGPFDLIWCAGAIYFTGIEKTLKAWRPALSKTGAVAFSEPCFFTDTPSDAARAFWEGYATQTQAGIQDSVTDAGFETLATRHLSAAAWDAYFAPLEQRIAQLAPSADPALAQVLTQAEQEIATWRACQDETGYLLTVARPR